MLLLALALLVSPVPPDASLDDILVNRFAIVQSDDGYLNLRPTPSTAQDPVRSLENGTLVLVMSCEAARRGRRWCRILTESVFAGYVYDAELAYDPPEPIVGGRSIINPNPGSTNAEGAGAPSGFRATDGVAHVRSVDGYLNLREGPSSARDVLSRIPNGMSVQIHGCERGERGRRWCFVDVIEWRVFGYVYDRELVYEPHR